MSTRNTEQQDTPEQACYETLGLGPHTPVLALHLSTGYPNCSRKPDTRSLEDREQCLLIGHCYLHQNSVLVTTSSRAPASKNYLYGLTISPWEQGKHDGVVVNGLFHYDGVFYYVAAIKVVPAGELTGTFNPELAVVKSTVTWDELANQPS